MLDELDRLRADPRLEELLGHYAKLGEADREAWHGRLMQLEGVEPKDLVKLHGELIAFNWVEQHTGHVPISYRITVAGQRALRFVQERESDDAEPRTLELPEKSTPKLSRKKRDKGDSPATLSLSASD